MSMSYVKIIFNKIKIERRCAILDIVGHVSILILV